MIRFACTGLVLAFTLLPACTEMPIPDAREPRAADSEPRICPLGGCVTAKRVEKRVAVETPSCASDPACAAEVERACAAAQGRRCTDAALALWGGDDGAKAMARVFALFERACGFKEAEACLYAGRMQMDGKGTKKDPARGAELLERACDGDVVRACSVLVSHLSTEAKRAGAPQAEPQGPRSAERFSWSVKCLQGAGDACFFLAARFERGTDGYPKDAAKSLVLYGKGCNAGNAPSCINLGNGYLYGEGVAKDVARAAGLFERACSALDMIGCANLGFMAEYGEGVAKDLTRAEELYTKACRERAYACIHLAMLEEYKKGAPRDPALAAARWERACTANDAKACSYLGVLAEDGKGLARDEARATELMRKACRIGEPHSCKWLRQRG